MSDDRTRHDAGGAFGEEHTRRRVLIGGATMLATAASLRLANPALAQEASPAAHPHGGATPEPQATPDAPPAPPFVGVTGQQLVDPEVRQSVDGLLDTTLNASIGPVTVAGVTVNSMNFEGQFPGPTLRLKQSETLKIALVNNLEDTTNLHTHGFHVSPEGNSDNIFIHVDPGTTFDYQYDLPPTNQPGNVLVPPARARKHIRTNHVRTLRRDHCRGGLDDLDGIAGLLAA
ncbi:MAG: multicopper oxidase domain-containing protein [Thermomicrobiales bacterium]